MSVARFLLSMVASGLELNASKMNPMDEQSKLINKLLCIYKVKQTNLDICMDPTDEQFNRLLCFYRFRQKNSDIFGLYKNYELLMKTCQIDDNKIKHAKQLLNNHMLLLINYALKAILGEHINEFKETLKKSGAIISGNFVLSAIFSDKCTNSDMDIYTHLSNKPVSQWSELNDRFPINSYTEIDMFLNKHYGKSHTHLGDKTKWIRYFIINKTDVLSININNEDLFNFDLCKVIYYFEDDKENIFIHDIDSIFNKGTINLHKHLLNESIQRYYK